MWSIQLAILFFWLGGKTFTLSYTGHERHWTDNGMAWDIPIHLIWIEKNDSSDLEMRITNLKKTPLTDTLFFYRLPEGDWKMTGMNRSKTIQSLGKTHFHFTQDSLTFSLGFGFSGEVYYLRKD